MDDEDHIHDLVWGRDELYKESLEYEFFYCLKQIENKTGSIPDNELSAVKVIGGGVVYKNISEIEAEESMEKIIRGNKVPKESAENIIKVIVNYLDNGWEMPREMREYISSRFKKAVKEDGENLQSLFHLRVSPKDEDKDKFKSTVADYIVFRYQLNSELKSKLKTDVNKSYFNNEALNDDIVDELWAIFDFPIKDHGKIKRLKGKSKKNAFLYKSPDMFLAEHASSLVKYRGYIKQEIEKGGRGEKFNLKIATIEWIEKSMK